MGVSSIARSSEASKTFHFIQNSTVTVLVPDRSTGALAELEVPLKRTAVLESPGIAPGTPSVTPLAVALEDPLLSASVVPLLSPIRQ